MKEHELKAFMERRGYILDKVARFRYKDRVCWSKMGEDTRGTLFLSQKLEQTPDKTWSQVFGEEEMR